MRLTGVTALSLVAGLAGLGVAHAQDTDLGKDLYIQYCGSCHGVEAKGDGPLTELLTQEVPDLTGLAARNDGVFPMLDVIHIVDGRTGVRSHGGPMPVWGEIFTEERAGMGGPYGDVLVVRGRVLSLALYLESVQE